MKLNEDYFYCFGCGATGDVIDLAARLFDLSRGGAEAGGGLSASAGKAVRSGKAEARKDAGGSRTPLFPGAEGLLRHLTGLEGALCAAVAGGPH